MKTSLCFLALASFFCLATTQSPTNAAPPSTYTNPILNSVGADPWVTQYDGYYYMTYTTNDNITILRSQVLTEWDNAEVKLAFSPPANTSYSYDLWAPELHSFDGVWYIIFTADVDADTPSPEVDMLCDFTCPAVNHRMFVLEASGPDPWESAYVMRAELDTYGQFAIDGTYFQTPTGLYHIYSCWYGPYISWPSLLCISEMSNPYTVSSPLSSRAIISAPTQPWEKTPYGRTINVRLSSNEGPEQLTNPKTNQTFVIYSAARSDNRDYCLGLLELTGNDPMDPSSWFKDETYCVFYQNPAEAAYGVGHASFTKSPDGTEDWIVYHGMKDYESGWSDRTIRTQRFYWDEKTGWPVFPRPGYGPYLIPSGQEPSGGEPSSASAKTTVSHTNSDSMATATQSVPRITSSGLPAQSATSDSELSSTYHSLQSETWWTDRSWTRTASWWSD